MVALMTPKADFDAREVKDAIDVRINKLLYFWGGWGVGGTPEEGGMGVGGGCNRCSNDS